MKYILDLVYMHPGGVRTAMPFFFYNMFFEKHPNIYIYVLTFHTLENEILVDSVLSILFIII